jgi:hypothetical protein
MSTCKITETKSYSITGPKGKVCGLTQVGQDWNGFREYSAPDGGKLVVWVGQDTLSDLVPDIFGPKESKDVAVVTGSAELLDQLGLLG